MKDEARGEKVDVTLCGCIVGGESVRDEGDEDERFVYFKMTKNEFVGYLKVVAKETKPLIITSDAGKVQFYLTKTADGAWLSFNSKDVETLKKGGKNTSVIDAILNGEKLSGDDGVLDVLENEPPVKTKQIHLLVVVPSGIEFSGITITIGEDAIGVQKAELEYYQERGIGIQTHHGEYCKEILDKIDEHCKLDVGTPLPFICVEGSSGMGKSQLAFALGGGKRPWLYWPATKIGQGSQDIYGNFKSISTQFRNMTRKDEPTNQSEEDILDSTSTFYEAEKLWTYGFIRALLEYFSLDENQHPRTIRFEKKKSFHVDKCDRDAVRAVVAKMKKADKCLPFFIVDEMSPDANQDSGGKNTTAFQRNVFRVCGLVVAVMGTGAKITNLVDRSGGSHKKEHKWMSVVSRFRAYEPVLFKRQRSRNPRRQL